MPASTLSGILEKCTTFGDLCAFCAVGPACPKCGGEMVLRTAKNGAIPGACFWGYRGYPRCKGMLNADA